MINTHVTYLVKDEGAHMKSGNLGLDLFWGVMLASAVSVFVFIHIVFD